MKRRDFLKTVAMTAVGAFMANSFLKDLMAFGSESVQSGDAGLPAVYMTHDISSRGLMAAYRALGHGLSGRVAVKLSTGEPGGNHFLSRELIQDLVHSVNGTIVEGNTAYGGRRSTTEEHRKAAEEHGFTAIGPFVILDENGDISLPVHGGLHLKEVRVGAHFRDYDSYLVLSHFKGHMMAGFGGALKNIAIGIASPAGKCLIHTAGNSETNIMDGPEKQEHFQESMAEAAEGMIRAVNGNMLYVNVLNNLSIDCDCSSHPAAPELPDIGILASVDPVALDRASVDQIYAADAQKSASLRERIEARLGPHILSHAERLGIGSQRYRLVDLD